jgi:glycosyltransferase involved in cell wall biosynthesis
MEDNKTLRVLITIPDIKSSGGVTALYKILKMDHEANCEYFNVISGKRIKNFRFIAFIKMYVQFCLKCFRYKIIHLNPSLNRNSYYRDMILIFIAELMRCKVIVHWHGWMDSFEAKIGNSKIRKMLFLTTYGRVDLCIVLGTVFKEKLLKLGYKKKILIETNCFDDSYLKNDNLDKNRKIGNPIRLLFLSRIEKQKGIYIAIDTLSLLTKKGYNCELIVAGTGNEIESTMKYINDNNLENIIFVGYVSGIEKHKLLKDSHFLLLPSFYSEGLPLTLLEGMAYGLPIVTRPVGSIKDIIINGENGYLTESMRPDDYVEIIERLINDKEKYKEISQKNILKAHSMFLPEKLKKRLITVYNNI